MIPKFRAWHESTELMEEVVLIDFYNEQIGILYANPISQGESVKIYSFDEVVLMQSTGLKDKNGIEIFEGDIVKNINTESKGRVIWDTHNTGWHYSVKKKANSLFDTYTLFRSKHNLEVIGNIHENPELLEVENE